MDYSVCWMPLLPLHHRSGRSSNPKNLQKLNQFIDYYIYWRPLLPLHHSLVIANGIFNQIEDLILHAYKKNINGDYFLAPFKVKETFH